MSASSSRRNYRYLEDLPVLYRYWLLTGVGLNNPATWYVLAVTGLIERDNILNTSRIHIMM
jgi:hypothetical protein